MNTRFAIKTLSALLLALLVCGRPAGAEDFKLNTVRLADLKEAPRSAVAPAAVPAAAKKTVAGQKDVIKDWTVMVFMNAKNNLGNFAKMDVKEMEQVGSTDNMNVVVELGLLKEGSKRLFIRKSGRRSNSEVLYSDANADMGDYRHAIDFVKWARANYPARHYMFIIWNHGLGWIDPVMQQHASGQKGISFDDETKNYIRTMQMGEILRQTGKVDVFASNACLMQMAEVAYEMKDYAGAIVGSEETMLAYGFDYGVLLDYITKNPGTAPAAIGATLVHAWNQFMAYPQLTAVPGTLSTINPVELNNLPAKLDAFASAVMAANDTDAVKYALANVVRFTSVAGAQDPQKTLSDYGDLYDFARLVAEKSSSSEVKAVAGELMGFISDRLVLSYMAVHTDEHGEDYTHARGVAIELTMKRKPKPAQFSSLLETKYRDLSLSHASRWADFVDWTDKVWNN